MTLDHRMLGSMVISSCFSSNTSFLSWMSWYFFMASMIIPSMIIPTMIPSMTRCCRRSLSPSPIRFTGSINDPEKPTLELALSKVTRQFQKNVSPRRIPSMLLRQDRLQLQQESDSLTVQAEGGMASLAPWKVMQKVGQFAVSSQSHISQAFTKKQLLKYVDRTMQNNFQLKQIRLVPESNIAVFGAQLVKSSPPSVVSARISACQQDASDETETKNVLLRTESGMMLQYMQDKLGEAFISSVKAAEDIFPALKAKSRKLGVLVYPIPMSP